MVVVKLGFDLFLITEWVQTLFYITLWVFIYSLYVVIHLDLKVAYPTNSPPTTGKLPGVGGQLLSS